jgi:hypothetical protein
VRGLSWGIKTHVRNRGEGIGGLGADEGGMAIVVFLRLARNFLPFGRPWQTYSAAIAVKY